MPAKIEFRPARQPTLPEKEGTWPSYDFANISVEFDPNLGKIGLLELKSSKSAQTKEFEELRLRLSKYKCTPEKFLVFFDRNGVPRFVLVAGAKSHEWDNGGWDEDRIWVPKKVVNNHPYLEARRFNLGKHDSDLYVIGSQLHEFEDLYTPNATHVGLDLGHTIPQAEGHGPWTIPGSLKVYNLGHPAIGLRAIENRLSYTGIESFPNN